MSSRQSKRSSLSSIESSVTRLLVSTKHLLESLTQWARLEVDDKYVSDAYVKLGNDFRAASRAFSGAGVDISDIGDVPQALRVILESTLSEAPSQENLDRFLPNIRNIIVTLLQTLKQKQTKARSLTGETQDKIFVEKQRKPDRSSGPKPEPEEKPRSPVVKSDALAQLQNENVLQRRASKRFSAYQYAKLANMNPSLTLAPATPSSRSASASTVVRKDSETVQTSAPSTPNTTVVEHPKESHDISVFLRIESQTKKVPLKLPVTFASIRLLFVEKFAYSPGTASFPNIYISDPKTGVSYELEDGFLKEIQDGTLLCLNEVKAEEPKKHQDTAALEQLQAKIEALETSLSRTIKESIQDIKIPAPAPVERALASPASSTFDSSKEVEDLLKRNKELEAHLKAVSTELRVIRQLQSSNKTLVSDFVRDLGSKMKKLHESSVDVSKSENREYMAKCHSKLSEESDLLLTKFDDLQDIMEGLRKDVVQRGVRVNQQQLRLTTKEIEDSATALKEMTSYIEKEKTVWKKIWESELDKVCEEQQFFNLQDDLTKDLEEDLSKIRETLDLIEQCSSEQIKHGSSRRNKFVANLRIPEPGENIHSIKDAVLNEVAALTPDHESRVEAINRAERLREKERELLSKTQFQEELGNFVDDHKLKKSGGIDEVERQRRQKDSDNLKSSFANV